MKTTNKNLSPVVFFMMLLTTLGFLNNINHKVDAKDNSWNVDGYNMRSVRGTRTGRSNRQHNQRRRLPGKAKTEDDFSEAPTAGPSEDENEDEDEDPDNVFAPGLTPGQPSLTSSPTSSPPEVEFEELDSYDVAPDASPVTSAPTPIHASCQAAQAGDVYETSTSETVDISYELLTEAGSPLSMLTTVLDGLFQDYLALELVDCSLAAESDIQGIGTDMISTFTAVECKNIKGYDDTAYFCFVMQSSLKVYLSDTSDLTTMEIQDAVWSTLRDAINGPEKSNRRMLQPFTSEFVNPDMGIADLYFLNQPSSSVSQVNEAQNGQTEQGMSRQASGLLMGFVFAVFGIIGLVFMRRNRSKSDQDSMFKATVLSGGPNNSYQNEFHGGGSPHKRMSEFDDFVGEGIEVTSPGTPSQLSCPTDGSAISIPPASLFEAYEATPAQDGDDHIVYNYGNKRRPGSSRGSSLSTRNLRTQEVLPVDQSDELLDQPPPFLSNIPRSARARPSRTKTSRSSPKQQDVGVLHLGQSVARVVTTTTVGKPQKNKPRISVPNPADDWERQAFPEKPQSTGDSFSTTGFLNGHCAAMEEFHRVEQEQAGKVRKSNTSPTSVCAPYWVDPKTPSMSNKNTYMSSVNLWTSQCDDTRTDDGNDTDVQGNDDDNRLWMAWNYVSQGFSPYGNGEPAMDVICGKIESSESPERGRSPTPIDHATNARRKRSKTHSRSKPRNPPGHRIKTYADPEVTAFKTQSSMSPSQLLRSSARRKPSPRFTSSQRGSSHLPVYASDTVQF